MLEIIALIFLCRKNGTLAAQKGLKPGVWKLYTVLAWLLAEFIGIGLGLSMFGKTNLIAVGMVGLFTAFGGYLLIKFILENKPGNFTDDVNKIGIDDLRPPKK
ncbi:MAG TPA: hypothetical protein PKC39_01170 [Ferruginibacter sp.]|nr:hypothetical protein [Ferruginibacter sp.]HMP19543.1 hypothetical protein [Ferruginibacter sp.]